MKRLRMGWAFISSVIAAMIALPFVLIWCVWRGIEVREGYTAWRNGAVDFIYEEVEKETK